MVQAIREDGDLVLVSDRILVVLYCSVVFCTSLSLTNKFCCDWEVVLFVVELVAVPLRVAVVGACVELPGCHRVVDPVGPFFLRDKA